MDDHGVKTVSGFCSDNEPKIKSAWCLLEEKHENDNIYMYGCVAHILNLLVENIRRQQSVFEIMAGCIKIVKEIKFCKTFRALLESIQNSGKQPRISLKFPAKIR